MNIHESNKVGMQLCQNILNFVSITSFKCTKSKVLVEFISKISFEAYEGLIKVWEKQKQDETKRYSLICYHITQINVIEMTAANPVKFDKKW